MTGFATSAWISFVEYNIKLQENITYFISDLIWYYRVLYRLKKGLNSSISVNEKIEVIAEELIYISNHVREKKQLIEVELLLNTKKNKYFIEMIENTYELTFGIYIINIELLFKSNKKKTLKIKKEYINYIKEMIEVQFKQIEDNIKGLNKFKLYTNWKMLKEKYFIIEEGGLKKEKNEFY